MYSKLQALPICASKRLNRSGFTLLELSLVIAIFAIIITGVMAAVNQDSRRSKQVSLQAKMDAIEEALKTFSKYNNRIPCPAQPTDSITTSTFGMEAGAAGACSNNAGVGTWTDGVNTYAGVVPTRTLGLPDDFAFDPWGGKFTYMVDQRATASTSGVGVFATNAPNSNSLGSITVNDANGAARNIVAAVAVVISHGPNGHGAYQFSQSGTSKRKNSVSNNTDELTNCHCTNMAAEGTHNNIVVQEAAGYTSGFPGNQSYFFDDTVRYYLRSNFIGTANAVTEKGTTGAPDNLFNFTGAVSR